MTIRDMPDGETTPQKPTYICMTIHIGDMAVLDSDSVWDSADGTDGDIRAGMEVLTGDGDMADGDIHITDTDIEMFRTQATEECIMTTVM